VQQAEGFVRADCRLPALRGETSLARARKPFGPSATASAKLPALAVAKNEVAIADRRPRQRKIVLEMKRPLPSEEFDLVAAGRSMAEAHAHF